MEYIWFYPRRKSPTMCCVYIVWCLLVSILFGFDFRNGDFWIADSDLSVRLVQTWSPFVSTAFAPYVPSKTLSESRCAWVPTKAEEMSIFFQWGSGYCSNKVFDQNKMRCACLMRSGGEVMWIWVDEWLLDFKYWRASLEDSFSSFSSLTSVKRDYSKKSFDLWVLSPALRASWLPVKVTLWTGTFHLAKSRRRQWAELRPALWAWFTLVTTGVSATMREF